MKTFEVIPFVGAGPLRFGMNPTEVHQILGMPRRSSFSRRSELDEDYAGISIGYSRDAERLVEIGFVIPTSVRFNGSSLFAEQNVVEMLASLDTAPVEGLGFIVFPHLGIALADFFSEQESDRAITVFAHGRWDDLKGFKPFALPRG